MQLTHRFHARCACAAAAQARGPHSFVLPGTLRKFERDRPFVVRHIALDLVLDIPHKAIEGTATLHLERVDPGARDMRLDAVGFEIRYVRKRTEEVWQDVHHTYDGDAINIVLGSEDTSAEIQISYRAVPRRGLYFLAPDEHVQDRPTQVWSQCQDEDARYWIPCHDKPHVKQSTEMRVRVPHGWYALSNGALVERVVGASQDGDSYHWKMKDPHPSYLITLVAGEFSELDGGDIESIALRYLVPKGREEDGRRTFAQTPSMVAHFGHITGVPYPWEKYTQVVVSDFIFGGMENTSATTLYEYVLLDERAHLDITSDDLIAHELAHQWFGDYVTCRDWSHGWLNEGFATFFEHVYREKRLGLDEYEYGIKQDQDAYLAEVHGRYRRPIVSQDYEVPLDLFDRHLYEKGGLVLHMLRRMLGEEVFWKGVHIYLQRHAFGLVETRDLCRALEEVSGRSLERFFEQWVYSAGHPELNIKIDYADSVLTVQIKQQQKGDGVPLFALDFELVVYRAEGAPRREVLHVQRQEETFVLTEEARPHFVVLDPHHRMVGPLQLEAPLDMLHAQLSQSPTARGRWLAAQALGHRDDPITHDILKTVLLDEHAFWGLRAETAYALSAIRSEEALGILSQSISAVSHPKVRRAMAWALGHFRKIEAAHALQPLALSDPSYVVQSEAARSLGSTRQLIVFDTLLEMLDRSSWSDLVRNGAIDGLANLRDERAVPYITAKTRYGVPTRARRAAIRALPRLTTDRKSRELLEELLEERDPYLRVDVVLALSDIGDVHSRSALERILERDLDGRVRRRIREVLRTLDSSQRAEHQRLVDELEKLRAEFGEMRARLAKLEATQPTKASAKLKTNRKQSGPSN